MILSCFDLVATFLDVTWDGSPAKLKWYADDLWLIKDDSFVRVDTQEIFVDGIRQSNELLKRQAEMKSRSHEFDKPEYKNRILKEKMAEWEEKIEPLLEAIRKSELITGDDLATRVH